MLLAAELAGDYVQFLSPLLVVEEADLLDGLRLFAVTERLGSLDAVPAAAAGADALVSADEAFSSLTTVTHIVPDDHGIRRILPDGDARGG